jgi:hypothetical protein
MARPKPDCQMKTNFDQPKILNEAGIERAPDWRLRLAARIERPFGIERELAALHSWESIRK